MFNNPIAQYTYSKYLHENVKNEDGSNFFTGDVYDIVGEWQAHNFAAMITGGVLAVSIVPVMTLSYGDIIMNKISNYHETSGHLDLGSSIKKNKDWYVRGSSQVFKWINKICTLNFLEW